MASWVAVTTTSSSKTCAIAAPPAPSGDTSAILIRYLNPVAAASNPTDFQTRLSLEVATGMLEAFPDGVWLVELDEPLLPMPGPKARELALRPRIALLCGRYEGVDQRVIEARGMIAEIDDAATNRVYRFDLSGRAPRARQRSADSSTTARM